MLNCIKFFFTISCLWYRILLWTCFKTLMLLNQT